MSVELHAAFFWDCDECGQENFIRAIEGNLEEPALATDENQVVGFLASNEGGEPDEDGMMESQVLMQIIAVAPRVVTCSKCGESHQTDLGLLEIDEDDTDE